MGTLSIIDHSRIGQRPGRAKRPGAGRALWGATGLLVLGTAAVAPAGAAMAAPKHHAHHHVKKAQGPLSGTWTGSYSGSFQGTFKLAWAESGQALNGTIMISGFGNAKTPLNGTVSGNAITFGTVGSKSITYSGSFSKSSMSGSWKIQEGSTSLGSGSWSASKSSASTTLSSPARART